MSIRPNNDSGLIVARLLVSVVGLIFMMAPSVSAEPAAEKPAPVEVELDPIELRDSAMGVMETYCISCHGPKKQKGDIRLDALETIDPVDLQVLYGTAKEVLHFGEMPPEKAKQQPSKAERTILMKWLESQLTGENAKALAEKLKRSEYGNVVDHEALFSGAHVGKPGFTPDRRWLISEYIFDEKVNRLLDYYPTRTINGELQHVQGDSGVHWSPKSERGNKFRRTITNPFLLPGKVGVQYYGHDAVTSGTLLTMIGNAKRISGFMTSETQMKANYPAMFALMKTELSHREIVRARQDFLTKYTYVERLLNDIYGAEHQGLLPALTRIDIPYPGPSKKRQTNLGHLGRIDNVDLRAMLDGIATHGQGSLEIKKIIPREGKEHGPAYVDYGEADRAAFDEVILKSERDWVAYGVSESRIRNRIGVMKVFFDQWDMPQIYKHALGKDYGPPTYVPLDEAEMAVIVGTIKKHRQKGDAYQQIIDKCLADWTASFKAERKAAGGASDKQLADLVVELYSKILEREPTAIELADNRALMRSYQEKLETQSAIAKLCESLLLRTEFVYRNEFGVGAADAHGRRMLSPRDASYALAYALTDSSPDAELVKAAKAGQLSTQEDYEREVRRMLKRRDQWSIIDEAAQAEGMTASVTNQPIRKLRFFRDFFGYPKAMKVFKDDHRFGAGRVDGARARLVSEADLLVEYFLEQDKNVVEELLTTDKFYVFHSGENEVMQASADRLRRVYEHFKGYDWKNWEADDLAPHKAFMATIWEFQKMKQDDKSLLRGFQRHMAGLVLQFGAGQKNGAPYMKQARGFWHGGPVHGRTGQQMRGEQVTTFWNIDWRTWDYPTQQPATIPDRKGMLTHPAWLLAHAQNLETDPIHRGKWVREKLLAGTIPDVPITVDAVIPPDHTKTLRQRMEDRTGDSFCWRCHQKMDPLGFPFELYDDFGRFRIDERLEHPDNLIAPAKEAAMTYGFKVAAYKTLPVDPRGVLRGTGDPKLDGDVKDAFDIIDRLGNSERVRQSIIRYAFRYFMGRNERLSDSKTLIDAERAYLENGGSFDELIVSLLTSDSFMYRRPTPADATQASVK